ncbi:hypothetical protein [Amycolatopsis thermophila]|uniref:Uncharacterized protein n=1 Tax=Amycolatopsis thermophila TaxID=206084 RepID=A0ABU0EUS0_9PSEU|nr:hypothetical protein [Amycolatopsis thermophila]MDQ0379031.1 hypothetical protein [Amycolatopsis thermophila]
MNRQDEEDRLERKRIAELADQWRSLAGALPFWTEAREGDTITLRNQFGDELLVTLHGRWAQHLAQYLGSLQKTAGCALAELLWTIGGHGDSVQIRRQARELLRAMLLEEPRPPGRRR